MIYIILIFTELYLVQLINQIDIASYKYVYIF